jgi:hypothetical protein
MDWKFIGGASESGLVATMFTPTIAGPQKCNRELNVRLSWRKVKLAAF